MPRTGFTEDVLERALARAGLSVPDRALCRELVYGVVRWRAALDWLIARKTRRRRQDPALKNLLRLGLYQIFWLDRIPPHAAVHETVELARRGGFRAQAGFVNAVLRGCLRESDETRKLLADLKISDPAVGWSHPRWLVERWQRRFGPDRTRRLLEWNNTPPKTFARVNTLRIDAGQLLKKWREENVACEPVHGGRRQIAAFPSEPSDLLPEAAPPQTPVFELKSHPPLASLDSFRDGWFYIQDPGTLLAVKELDPQPGETILDLCAAPGGKTTCIAQIMRNEGRIVACDVSETRLKLLRENCQRLGATCVEEFMIDDFRLTSQKQGWERQSCIVNRKFDRILVDAPCSNTGVLRRRVDLRWRISREETSRLQRTQLDLLKLAAPKLQPGGILVYSTCSLEPEENQQVIGEFLREHERFRLESERELLPFADDVDGAYVAKLTWKG